MAADRDGKTNHRAFLFAALGVAAILMLSVVIIAADRILV